MANGDIEFKTLYRQSFGGGQDASGTKKNTKTLVVGEITGDYVSTGLVVNGPHVFGLTAIDYIKLEPITSAGLYHTAAAVISADYNSLTGKIIVVKDNGAAVPAKAADADAQVIRFFAVGDDADAPELT